MDVTPLSATSAATPTRSAGLVRDRTDIPANSVAARLTAENEADAATTVKPVDEPSKEDPAVLKKTVDELNAAMKGRNNAIEFSIDEDSGKTVVKIMDLESNTVIKQYPSRELLAIAKQIDKFQGTFVKTQA